MITAVIQGFRAFANLLQKSAPYLLVEILLPGGTLFALFLFLYEHRHKFAVAKPSRLHVVAAHRIAMLRKEFVCIVQPNGVAASVWRGRNGERAGIEVLAMARAA